MKEKREGGAMERTRKPVSSALSKAGFSRKNNRRGFTLAEVLIVVAIIAVLTAVAIPVFTGQLEKNRDSVTATNLRAAYDEANATLLAQGKKPSDGVTIPIDGVVFKSTDNSLPGEKLPFALPAVITPANTYTVLFHFAEDSTSIELAAAGSGGSDTIPLPTSEPSATPSPKRTITDIEISKNPTKTTYNEGESFVSAGMQLKVTYDSGEPDYVSEGYSCSNVGPYAIAGSYTVTVRYEGKTVPLTITVNKRTVEWIKIARGPDKDEYTEGEEFNPEGMVVTARFSDDSADSEPHIIPATDYICRPASGDELTASVTCVTVSYEGQMDTWLITVGAPILKEITVDGAEFEEGETFDQSKLIVTAYYENARPKPVSISDCEILDLPTFSNPLQRDETYSFTVKYTEGEGEDQKEESADVTFTVKKAPLTGISVEVADDYYHVGDKFSKSGLTVTATYKNKFIEEYSEVISGEAYSLDPALDSEDAPTLEERDYEVEVSYTERGETKKAPATIPVTESTLTGLTVVVKDTVTYYVGDTVKKTDLTVTAKYENGHTKELNDDAYILDNDTPLVEGENTISVTYQGKPATTSYVASKADFDKIRVTVITSYCVGDTFDKSGLKVEAVYKNGYPEEIQGSGYTYKLTYVPTSETVSEGAKLEKGDYQVEVTALEIAGAEPVTATFPVTEAELDRITVTVNCYVGDSFDKSKMTVWAYYKNNFDTKIKDEDYEYTLTNTQTSETVPEGTKLVAGEYKVDVTFNGMPKSETFTVSKAPLSSIAITGDPNKTEYFVGESFATDGMEVTATYENGYTEVVTGYSCTPESFDTAGDEVTVTISYSEGGITKTDTTLKVKVKNPSITSVEIIEDPANTVYYVGEEFDASGLQLKVSYDYGDPKYPTYGDPDYPTSDFSFEGDVGPYPNGGYDYKVTVKYKEVAAEDSISIKVAKLDRIVVDPKPKMSYTYNSYSDNKPKFEIRNMKVTAYYQDNLLKERDVTEYLASPTEFLKLTIIPAVNQELEAEENKHHYYTLKVTYEEGTRSKPWNSDEDVDVYNDYNTCFAPGTLITLADGTRKPIEELSFDDMLLVWDFKTGTYDAQPAVLLIDHGEHTYNVIGLHFSDGTLLRIVGEHGVFDYDLNRFVYISPENVADYIGHRFVKCALEGGYDLVTLESAEVTVEQITALSIVSSYDFNVFASDLLTMTPSPVAGSFDLMPMGETLRYDMDQFQKNVAEFGTYDYEVFAQYVTEEQFEAVNGAYMKILVESGVLSFEELCELAVFFSDFMN